MQAYLDSYSTDFSSFNAMFIHHEQQALSSQWERAKISGLRVAALDKDSSLYQTRTGLAEDVSDEAVEDTANNLKLALKYGGKFYPLRDTAWKGLLDRAKISGSVLPNLPKGDLAKVLNTCLRQHSNASALLLIRDEKISATHSGDEKDYSVLPIDKLLETAITKLEQRFPGCKFESGYSSHAIASASWTLPNQRDDLLGRYRQILASSGKTMLASKLMPGILFTTSDVGISSAKLSALIYGMQEPIHIGGMLAIDHRGQKGIEDFSEILEQLFAQYESSVAKLTKLTTIVLNYPVNAMAGIAKKLSLPKKARDSAVEMFEAAYGDNQATAHDVFIGLQEVIFNMKVEGARQSDILTQQENLSRALTFNWSDYDRAKKVS